MLETSVLQEYLWNSVCDSFETMIMMPVEKVIEEEGFEYNGILLASSITFTGDIKGCLALLCSFGCAKKITKSMLMLDDEDELDENEVKDALGEVANLVIGGFKSRLMDTGDTINLSIPTVTKGRRMRPALGLGAQRFSLFAKGGGYLFEFVFAYK